MSVLPVGRSVSVPRAKARPVTVRGHTVSYAFDVPCTVSYATHCCIRLGPCFSHRLPPFPCNTDIAPVDPLLDMPTSFTLCLL
eukprot:358410-Chlamydomonas_euryale.AAC.2